VTSDSQRRQRSAGSSATRTVCRLASSWACIATASRTSGVWACVMARPFQVVEGI
jgi:hypothetical protein